MWKLLYQSVLGTAHRRTGQPCQDRCRVRQARCGEETVLVLACADGAGSAALSAVGAGRACRTITNLIAASLERGLAVGQIDPATVAGWYRRTRAVLEVEAQGRGEMLRQLASTLLVAVVGESAARFAQIGDGAIVILDGDRYRVVFWPQSGEYANATHFLTDQGWEQSLTMAALNARVDELALLSDGLQALCLNYAARAAHGPFFAPMFRPLRAASCGANLLKELRQFLDSPRVNERTDDDKTLILATRVPPRGHDSQTV
jgi:hypothetical protein